ncbi:MAG: MFS transporter [Clostridium sp.]|uniref:MFS transporter n=1 Tax=Clostridium sp. TaxID=1506 RepID=UPI0025C4FF08|nr:MFS transporter [Clostridium sp.]MCH3965449.1 MFS transporter [Clostridium sp.]MCI1717270.1 MFS transporter [Clostridium sp.]MCI1801610.1 MFS transporter [Clostridium sp.]MCI1815456.1 MFS transporter [Clostridium sp.]MCI1872359.1 MFS transporter [Clostridium sp.]
MKKKNYKWIALSCTTIGVLFSVLSASTLMIALPVIMKDLNAGIGIITWTIMGYMLSLTIFVPSIGRIADMFGRKKLYVSGFAVFTVASLFCAMSESGIQLLVFRMIQSIGASLMIANSTVIITDVFPKSQLGKALGINAMVVSVAAVIGPILGGILINFSWRSIFYINIPIGLFGTIWAAISLVELHKSGSNEKFDFKGTFSFTFGMLALLVALTIGGFGQWFSRTVIILFTIAAILIGTFAYIENHTRFPMLDMTLLKTRILSFAYISTLLNGIARGAVTFLLIFYFEGDRGIDPITAGILLCPFAAAMMAVSPISGVLCDRYGARILSSIGLLISAVGLLGFMEIKTSSSIFYLVVCMIFTGIGSGMFFSPNTSSIMANVPEDKRGIAAGVRVMFMNAGMVLSIAISMAIISSSISPSVMQALFVHSHVSSNGIASIQFMSGLRTAFTISFIFSLIAAFISYLRGPAPKWEEQGQT